MPQQTLGYATQYLSYTAGTAPGSNFSITVPTDEIWIVMSINADFTADANAADRLIGFSFLNATPRRLFITHLPTKITANQTWLVEAGASMPIITNSIAFLQITGFPTDLIIPAGGTINSITTNIQVGDQYTDIVIVAQRFISPRS